MSKHWQDTLCPFCGMTNGFHASTCEWFMKQAEPRLTHRGVVIPKGIEAVVSMDEIVDYLNAPTNTDKGDMK